MESKRLAAPVLRQLACLAHAEKQHEHSAKLLGKIDAQREEMGSSLPPRDRTEHNAATEDARRALGEEIFSDLWTRGRNAALDQLNIQRVTHN
jgi:hypothetical protein